MWAEGGGGVKQLSVRQHEKNGNYLSAADRKEKAEIVASAALSDSFQEQLKTRYSSRRPAHVTAGRRTTTSFRAVGGFVTLVVGEKKVNLLLLLRTELLQLSRCCIVDGMALGLVGLPAPEPVGSRSPLLQLRSDLPCAPVSLFSEPSKKKVKKES